MKIEVIFALPDQQELIELNVPEICTVRAAIRQSNLLQKLNLDENHLKVGVFSRHVNLDDTLKPGDRIEIYRPLTADPKEIRRQRAKEVEP
ncbi:MAG: RnfH family protein [Gammaproteobacteria bacterium]|nr:RnfH family protein [Gammaproteobacteria bacterium]